jgi:hypothetical protein
LATGTNNTLAIISVTVGIAVLHFLLFQKTHGALQKIMKKGRTPSSGAEDKKYTHPKSIGYLFGIYF